MRLARRLKEDPALWRVLGLANDPRAFVEAVRHCAAWKNSADTADLIADYDLHECNAVCVTADEFFRRRAGIVFDKIEEARRRGRTPAAADEKKLVKVLKAYAEMGPAEEAI